MDQVLEFGQASAVFDIFFLILAFALLPLQ